MTTSSALSTAVWGEERAKDTARLAAAHAQRFPWYGRLLDRCGARHTGRLSDLPLIDQGVLSEHYYLADHSSLADASVYHTSGTSTGRRKSILYSAADDDAYIGQRRELFQRFIGDVKPGAPAVADLGTGHAAASARRVFEEMGLEAHDIDFQTPISEHVKRLNMWQPEVLFTMPMILDRLMRSPDQLRINPRKIMVVGDLAPDNWRRMVARHFGLEFSDVLDLFGSIEVGAIAHSCAETGLYHFHDHILPEVVRQDDLLRGTDGQAAGRPTVLEGGGGSGALLLTSFTRGYFPALRYVTGDHVTGLRVITHEGRRVYACERVDGRLSGDLKHGERISNYDLCRVMAEVFPGAAFETVNDGLLRIRVAAESASERQLVAVREQLKAAAPDVAQMIDSGLVADIEVQIVSADDLRSGNAKRRFDLKAV